MKIHISNLVSWQLAVGRKKPTAGKNKRKKPTGAQGNMKRSSSVDASSTRYAYGYYEHKTIITGSPPHYYHTSKYTMTRARAVHRSMWRENTHRHIE